MKNKKTLAFSIIKMMILIIITFIFFFPMIITISTSFKPPQEVITATPKLLPQNFTLQNYQDLFNLREFPGYLKNSFIVASFTAVISVIISSLAACAVVWMKFPGKRIIINSILFTYMFPGILLVIPLFIMCYQLNLIDSKLGLVLTYLSFSVPFNIWMLKSYFESIPKELVEAALIDGCSYFNCLIRVVLPVSLPAVATVGIYSFILGWSEYLFANTIITTDTNRTIAIGLQTLKGYHRVNYGLITAASVIMVVPVLLLFILVQKYFIEGLTVGSVKE